MVRKATIQDLDSIFELVEVFATSFNPQKNYLSSHLKYTK